MNTENIGKVSLKLGAGREYKDEAIDYSSGITVLKKTGDYVEIGDTLAILHTNNENAIEEAKNLYLDSIEFTNIEITKKNMIYEVLE